MTDELHNHTSIGMQPPGECPACDQVRLGFGPSRFRRAYTNDYPRQPITWRDWLLAAAVVTLFVIFLGIQWQAYH